MHNDPALNITLLKTFVAVAEMRNLTAAGAALGLSQPTVSQHLQRLEEYLGRPLLRRDTRPIKLTPAGEKLLGGLPDLLAGFDRHSPSGVPSDMKIGKNRPLDKRYPP